MQLYDFDTTTSHEHRLPINVLSGYVQVDRNTVLIVGRLVRKLDLLTLQTTPLTSLLTPRDYVGVAQMGNRVFAFGEYKDSGPSTICEYLCEQSSAWTQLPPMHNARCWFTPCPFKALLYLTSTYANDRAVESYSPHTETFTVLFVSPPAQLQLTCGSVREQIRIHEVD